MNHQLNESIDKAMQISKLFILWNVLFFIAALLVQNTIIADAVGSVLLRGGVYAIGGLIFVYLLRQMKQGKRSGWLRLSIISVLAPLGAIAFIAFTPHLPAWFILGQIGAAVMIAMIGVIVLKKSVRTQFRKNNAQPTLDTAQ